MAKMTEKMKKECIALNINMAEIVINEAERVNKGMWAHDINLEMSILKNLLKKKDEFNYDDKNNAFYKMLKSKHSLAAFLFYSQKNI